MDKITHRHTHTQRLCRERGEPDIRSFFWPPLPLNEISCVWIWSKDQLNKKVSSVYTAYNLKGNICSAFQCEIKTAERLVYVLTCQWCQMLLYLFLELHRNAPWHEILITFEAIETSLLFKSHNLCVSSCWSSGGPQQVSCRKRAGWWLWLDFRRSTSRLKAFLERGTSLRPRFVGFYVFSREREFWCMEKHYSHVLQKKFFFALVSPLWSYNVSAGWHLQRTHQ